MKETLEEAADRLQKDKYGIFISKDIDVKGQLVIDTAKAAFKSGMIEGAKWQQEQDKNKYSEEEVIFFIKEAINYPSLNYNRVSVEDWFKQFKKE
jgi:hypothetical protein